MGTDWEFHLPTRVRFGRGTLDEVGASAARLGSSALLVGYADQLTSVSFRELEAVAEELASVAAT